MTYEALFFDFDGVLADSVDVKTRAFAKIFSEFGPEIESKVVEHHLANGGMSRFDKFRYYYEYFLGRPLSPQNLDTLCQRFAGLVFEEVSSCPEIPGSTDFLEKWWTIQPCFIISATPEEEIRNIARVRGVAHYFKNILGSPASKEDNIKIILDLYKFTPGSCLFLGDAESDYKAASAWGLDFIGILPGPEAPLLKIAPTITWYPDFLKLEIKN